MSNGLKDDLADMMTDPTIPANVTNRMLLAVLSEIYTTISRMEKEQKAIDEHIVQRLKDIEVKQESTDRRLKELEDNPSIVWLLRFRTRQTISALLVVFILLTFLIANMPDIVWAWLGLPAP